MPKSTTAVLDEVQEFLQYGVSDVFNTMLSVEAESVAPPDLCASKETIVAGSIGFTGDVNGVVHLHVTAPFARTLAGRLLGLSEAELSDDSMVNDAIGELSNMIVGSVKSRLCDAGSACVLTIPSVVRGSGFHLDATGAHAHRALGFQCGADQILIQTAIKVSP